MKNLLKRYKSITPGLRFKCILVKSNIWNGLSIKKLTSHTKKSSGRNCNGRITIQHRGGGSKIVYKFIDNKCILTQIGIVKWFEIDSQRTAYLALVVHTNGTFAYRIASKNMRIGTTISSLVKKDTITVDGIMAPLYKFVLGTLLHNVELNIGHGGQLVRAAGTAAVLMNKNVKYATIKLPSGKLRKVHINCTARVGVVSNELHYFIIFGKAGTVRLLGKRPIVRGVAKNPVDHPHGGNTSGGRPSVSPWGKLTKGYKTRKIKFTNMFHKFNI